MAQFMPKASLMALVGGTLSVGLIYGAAQLFKSCAPTQEKMNDKVRKIADDLAALNWDEEKNKAAIEAEAIKEIAGYRAQLAEKTRNATSTLELIKAQIAKIRQEAEDARLHNADAARQADEDKKTIAELRRTLDLAEGRIALLTEKAKTSFTARAKLWEKTRELKLAIAERQETQVSHVRAMNDSHALVIYLKHSRQITEILISERQTALLKAEHAITVGASARQMKNKVDALVSLDEAKTRAQSINALIKAEEGASAQATADATAVARETARLADELTGVEKEIAAAEADITRLTAQAAEERSRSTATEDAISDILDKTSELNQIKDALETLKQAEADAKLRTDIIGKDLYEASVEAAKKIAAAERAQADGIVSLRAEFAKKRIALEGDKATIEHRLATRNGQPQKQ